MKNPLKIFSNIYQGIFRIVNATFEAPLLPVNVRGTFGYRVVGRVQGQSKMNPLAQFTFYGGYLVG